MLLLLRSRRDKHLYLLVVVIELLVGALGRIEQLMLLGPVLLSRQVRGQ